MPESLTIVTRGRGPDLVLLHGWAMHSGVWGGVLDSLASGFRVHLVDLPGHGCNRHFPLSRDPGEVAGQILDCVPAAVWMGWSLGGLVTLAAATRQPWKVHKAVLVAATPSFSKRPHWDCGVDAASRRAFCDGLENDPAETLEQFWTQCFGAAWVGRSLELMGKASVTDGLPASRDLLSGLHLLYESDLRAAARACNVPALFLGGARDRTIRPESYTRAAKMMPLGDACIMRGAGHAPFITHPDGFLDIIRGFLKGDKAA